MQRGTRLPRGGTGTREELVTRPESNLFGPPRAFRRTFFGNYYREEGVTRIVSLALRKDGTENEAVKLRQKGKTIHRADISSDLSLAINSAAPRRRRS